MNKCLCGCGGEVAKGSKYLRGHHLKKKVINKPVENKDDYFNIDFERFNKVKLEFEFEYMKESIRLLKEIRDLLTKGG